MESFIDTNLNEEIIVSLSLSKTLRNTFRQAQCDNKLLILLLIVTETLQLVLVGTPIFIDFNIQFQMNLLAKKLL